MTQEETDKVLQRYARRSERGESLKWRPVDGYNVMARQEKYRCLAKILGQYKPSELPKLRVLEIGCGDGVNIADLISLGINPELITGIDALSNSIDKAKLTLPESVELISGDAQEFSPLASGYDIVMQQTVFTSLLDLEYKQILAKKMWSWLKPGGRILWYDFVYNNYKNSDVKGVPYSEIKSLFPEAIITKKRVTLAPPIARVVCKFSTKLYTAFNAFPMLRTHVFCELSKKQE